MIEPLYGAPEENNNIDKRIDHASENADKLEYIRSNLTLVFTDEYISSELSEHFYIEKIKNANLETHVNYLDIRNMIVSKLFLLAFNDMERLGGIRNFRYTNTYHALFDYELQSETLEINTVRFMRENKPDLVVDKDILIRDLIGIGSI